MTPAFLRGALAGLLLAGVAAATAAPDAADSVVWAVSDWPPAYIIQHDWVPPALVGQGWADQLIGALEKQMPDLHHEQLIMNSERIEQEMQRGAHVCASTVILTPQRDKSRYYTDANFSEPRYLMVRKESVARLPLHGGAVSLPELLRDKRLKGLLASGRSYGPQLDPIIRSHRDIGQIAERTTGDLGGTMMRMLLAGRMDYTIEYPSVLNYLSQVDPHFQELAALPIAEERQLGRSGISCPRTPWGRAMIARIDALMPALVASASYRTAHEKWLLDDERKALRQQIDDFYRLRSQAGRTNFDTSAAK